MPTEIPIRLKNEWRFVDAAIPRPNRFATAPTQKLDSKPRRRQCQNRPRISAFEAARTAFADNGSTCLAGSRPEAAWTARSRAYAISSFEPPVMSKLVFNLKD